MSIKPSSPSQDLSSCWASRSALRQCLLVSADGLCRAEHDPGLIHRLLSGGDRFQEAWLARRLRVLLRRAHAEQRPAS